MTQDSDWDRLMRGEHIIKDGYVWALCGGCGRVIKLNGWFGSIHLCGRKD